jgi:hypothetical protein
MEAQESWIDWWKRQVAGSTMEVEVVPLDQLKDWGLQSDGTLARHDGNFFRNLGVKVKVPRGREVAGWEQLLQQEKGQGCIIILVDEESKDILIQAKPEPGNMSEQRFMALYSALTASLSNLKQEHGGKKPPRAELFEKNEEPLFPVLCDGGRCYRKVNNYGMIFINKSEIVLNDNERWFTVYELSEALMDGYICEHLLASIGLLYLISANEKE